MIELINNKIILDNGYEIREYYTEEGNVRAFYSNDCIQSMIYVDKDKRNELVIYYFNFYNLPMDLNPNGTNYLMLGGGVFAYPKYYISKYKDKMMDVVEIDKECVKYAKKYFYLGDFIDNKRLNIIIDDAIKYISNCQKKYEYILVDLFDGIIPVREIYTPGNLYNLKRLLNTNGIIIVNYIVSEQNIDNYKEDLSNLIQITKYYKIITYELNYIKYNNTGNLFIILSDNEINIPDKYSYINVDDIFVNN